MSAAPIARAGCAVLAALLAALAVPPASCQDALDYHAPARVGTVDDARITELSGMIPIGGRPGWFWVHNDSDNSPHLFAVHESGSVVASVAVTGATNTDWEDIADGPGPISDRGYLFVADTGNNGLDRDELTVWRLPEPVLAHVLPGQILTSEPAAAIRFRYPDGTHNAEALVVHPTTGRIYLITKTAGTAGVYRFPSSDPAAGVQVLERLGDFAADGEVTAADLTADARRLLVRTFPAVQEYAIAAGADFEQIFFQPRRVLPDAGGAEPKSEAICFDLDDREFYTTDELRPEPIHVARVAVRHPSCELPAATQEAISFVRGNVVGPSSPFNSGVDIVDVVAISDALAVVAGSGVSSDVGCADRLDVDDDGALTNDDAHALLARLVGNDRPAAPFPVRGTDPTADELTCGVEPGPELVAAGAAWNYHASAEPPASAWRDVDHDVDSWDEAVVGIGVGVESAATTIAAFDGVLRVRREFDVGDPSAYDLLRLEIDYDDGFIAWINGVEVARSGFGVVGLEPALDTRPTRHPSGAFEIFSLCADPVRAGRNVLALEIHRYAAVDRTVYFDARLEAAFLTGFDPPPEPPGATLGARLYLEAPVPANVGESGELRLLLDSDAPVRAMSVVVGYDSSFRFTDIAPSTASLEVERFESDVDSVRRALACALFAGDREDAIPAGTAIELARLRYRVLATQPRDTTISFSRRSGQFRLENRVVGRDGAPLDLRTDDLDVAIVQDLRPRITDVINASGAAGQFFFITGSRFDGPELTVSVCDQAVEFVLSGGSTLRVQAPPCDRVGAAPIEVCTEFGCDRREIGFVYELDIVWIRGDANGDGGLDISDAVSMLGGLFLGEETGAACPEALDSNVDGRHDLSDAIFLLAYFFQGGVELAPPTPDAPAPCP